MHTILTHTHTHTHAHRHAYTHTCTYAPTPTLSHTHMHANTCTQHIPRVHFAIMDYSAHMTDLFNVVFSLWPLRGRLDRCPARTLATLLLACIQVHTKININKE